MSTRASDLSLGEQVGAVRTGSVTAEDLATQVRRAIELREPELGAWVCLSSTTAEQARAVDRGLGSAPLAGLSVGVKDLIDVAGMPTRAGSTVTSPNAVGTDAACVSRLRSLGAIVQGKTVTTEFGYFTPGPTRNPHALDHTPGGSSSGSAAAVAAGTVPLALGTQTAGSLTRPASYCGAAGMVLAHGTTDMSGITGLSESLDSLGLLTRSVADLRFVHNAFGHGHSEVPASEPVTRGLVWNAGALHPVEPPMSALLAHVPALLEEIGVKAEPLDWDDHVQTLSEDHVTVMSYEAARARAHEFDEHAGALSAPIRDLLENGRRIAGTEYAAALTRRDRSRELLDAILVSAPIIVGPAALGPAPSGLSATGSPILSRPWQLLGLPVVVVPGARTSSGLPLGLQIVGLPGHEDRLLDVGEKLEVLLRELPEIAV
ncbi:Asp-tRNAAsn / Glu-tRNAGln amidotransferase A subunit-related amidase [Rhodococcus ruber BKS 20-38]|uniref:amidase n=2 Tax=Rhodococcus TaxID=1827 RepID=M2YXH6_9NOCA|nr:amidase [Rhodococcus ruber]EME66675.1 Asp-tRNAAsn / Glu-tRNAGln amidotransferase A subunit-related amidase [Rhodococcus ruber BKS 20-38]